ncbi:hypothetical protein V8D89_001306, partial [Ganoderma adspersum]
LATLRACALVASGWTCRAQLRIFEWAEIYGKTCLYSFAEALRASPHLAAVVQRLTLIRRNQDPFNSLLRYLPDCAEGLFPTVLAGLLPNLRYLAFDDFLGLPRTTHVGHGSRRLRPYVPMHNRFPLLLSSSGFSDLRELRLAGIVFHTFNDFARMLHAFRQLRVLHCGDVDWVIPGVLLPPFMTTASLATRRDGEFLPVLEKLTVLTVGRHGVERLLMGLALNASLSALTISLPYIWTQRQTGPSVDSATGRSGGPDLSPFPRLSEVTILDVTPHAFRPAQLSVLDALRDLLARWDDSPPRSLTLWMKPSPFSSEGARFYTKQNYLSFLEGVGRTVEEACTLRRGSSIPTLCVHLEIPQDAKTPLEELEREAILLFPMALKAGKLTVEAHTSEYDYYSWKSSTVDVDGIQ